MNKKTAMIFLKRDPMKTTLIALACLAFAGYGQRAAAQDVAGERVIRQVQVQGNALVDDAEIQGALKPWLGKKGFGAAQLNAMRQAVSDLYRARGLGLTIVQIPPQDATQGTLRLVITETRLATVTIENSSQVNLDSYSQRLRTLEGQPADTDRLEHVVAILKATPGVTQVEPVLTAAAQPGQTQLKIKVRGQNSQRWEVLLDNSGAQTTGKNRLTASGDLSNPAGWGDRLSVSLTDSPRALQSNKDVGGVTSGQARYDVPVGGDGLRMGATFNKFTYALGDALAGGNFGEGLTGSIFASYPLSLQSHLTLGFDDARVNDAQLSKATRRAIVSPKLGVGGSALHEVGGKAAQLRYQVDLKEGRLSYEDAAQAVFNSSALGPFTKINVWLEETVQLSSTLRAIVKAGGQLTSKNLDSSERMALAGGQAVRGYPTGMQSLDQGAVVTAEVRYQVEPLKMTLLAFYDHGEGLIRRQPFFGSGLNDVKLSSAGVGLAWSLDQKYTVQAQWAKPLSGNTREAKKATSGLLWASVSAAF
jgi:hemolysin activation/secretion protein